jgi:RHS repeat-associated protein
MGSVPLVSERRDFFPFGEYIPADSSHGNRQLVTDGGQATYNANSGVKQQFTSQERDQESGLDYFKARNYSGPLGRFLSVDPGNAGAAGRIPQSWNSYAYVNNHPCRYADPTGMFIPAPQVGREFIDWYRQLELFDKAMSGSQGLSQEQIVEVELRRSGRVAGEALRRRAPCRDLFDGPDDLRLQPDIFLEDLADGGAHVSGTFGRIDAYIIVINKNEWQMNKYSVSQHAVVNIVADEYRKSVSAAIYVNGDWWRSASDNSRALTLIHEVGHIYQQAGILWGSAGSQILPDHNDPAQSLNNSIMIDDACFDENVVFKELVNSTP